MKTQEQVADGISAATSGTKARAVRSAILSAGSFSLMFALIKLLGKSYPSGEILFSRSFFALLPLLPVIMRNGGWQVFQTKRPWQHATRSTMGLISAYLCVEAVKRLPLAEATSLFYAAPLVTTLLALTLLKEKVSKTKGAAIFVGFLGVLYMLQPRLSSDILGAGLALASAVSSGFVYIELRRMAATEKSVTIVLYFMLTLSLAGLLTMPFSFVMPGPRDALLLAAIGITGGIGQIWMTEAYHEAPATTVAPLNYISLLWAVFLDIVLFGRYPNLEAMFGAIVIALSGICVIAPQRKPAETGAAAEAERAQETASAR